MCTNNFGTKRSNLTKFSTGQHKNLGITFWGFAPVKFGMAENIQNLARFQTTSDFDCEYLWKRKMALSTTIHPRFDEEDLVNFGPLTTKFNCLFSTHRRSPLRVLCRLMQLHLGHVTLPGAEFQSLKLSPQSDLWRQAASRWTLPKSLVFFLREISELRRPIGARLCHVVGRVASNCPQFLVNTVLLLLMLLKHQLISQYWQCIHTGQ